MNRQIEITLKGGGTFHVPSQQIVYMKPLEGAESGYYELGYMAGSRLVRRIVTSTPGDLESEVSYLAEIVNDRFSLINSNYILGTLDKGASHDLKYQIPEGRLIDLGVTMTVASLHNEMTNSVGNTDLNAVKASVAALTDVPASITSINDILASHTTQIAASVDAIDAAEVAIADLQAEGEEEGRP